VTQFSPPPGRSMSYDDLIELASLCLKQVASTSNATAAFVLSPSNLGVSSRQKVVFEDWPIYPRTSIRIVDTEGQRFK
jgi:hypothetical protein